MLTTTNNNTTNNTNFLIFPDTLPGLRTHYLKWNIRNWNIIGYLNVHNGAEIFARFELIFGTAYVEIDNLYSLHWDSETEYNRRVS